MADPILVGKIPSGLFIVTVTSEVEPEGFLASWVQQASFSPLMLSLAIQAHRPVLEILPRVGRFCVNVVGHQNNGLMKPFWGGLKPGENPMNKVAWTRSERGNAILADALCALECEFRSAHQPGDHVLVFGEVVHSQLLKPEDKPMTHVRKTGAEY